MAITDLQISDTLETGAPSIKYEGDMRPQQVAGIDPMLQEAYDQYVYDLKEQRPEATPMTIQEFRQWIMSGAQAGGADALRSPAAYGGIMDSSTGRRAYGWGSKLKGALKSVTKPIKKFAKSDLGKAALLYAGTAGLGNLLAPGGGAAWGNILGKGGWMRPSVMAGNWLGKSAVPGVWSTTGGPPGVGTYSGSPATRGVLGKWGLTKGGGSLMPTGKGALAALMAVPFTGLGMGKQESLGDLAGAQDLEFDFDYDEMVAEVKAAVKSGDVNEIKRVNLKYGLDLVEDVNVYAADGGRIGYYAGGQSVPSDYTMEDAMMTTTQDKLGGITDVMKQADLFRSGDIGQFYAAQGGRIRAQEGGLMDLGGMEKDYREEGGFVPIGGKEKADDVPARLSRNEFVFTADAVRNAGGGDIDKGAEIMENVMNNLEQGGQISDESQGLAGAQEMFDVSERLSEVV
jgi:hypothetical protein